MSTRSKNTRTTSQAAKKQKTDKTAKWTDEEHEAFLEGYKKHGDDWKKIAAKIKTRTMTQTRTYGQKFIEEQAEKEKETTPKKPRGRPSKAKSTPKKDEKKSPRGRRSKRQKEETEGDEEEVEPETEDKEEEEVVAAVVEEEVKPAKKETTPSKKAAEKKKAEKKSADKKEPPKKRAKKSATEKVAATPSKTNEGGAVAAAVPPAQNALQLPLTPGVPPAVGAIATPGSPSNFYTDRDILLPMNESVTSRPANREYLELLKANCVIFHSLPSAEQAWFVRNFCHFITTVRGRRWIGFHHFSGYRPLLEPLPAVAAEFRLDPLKRAAFQFHPLWLLGEHDPGNIHKGKPFVHRKVDGAWRSASVKDVREILTAEGSKNLLLLPPSIKMDDPKPKDDNAEEKTEEKKPAADESGKATDV